MTRNSHKTPGSHSQLYQYNELPCDGSFRYLTLYRGSGADPLRCRLQTGSVLKTKFEAISYVWGKSKKNKKIICDGRVINITTSLSNVLRRLRLPHRRRKLWADGICINQDDLNEKGHQVAMMGEIYRSATRVLIYVGSGDDGHGPQVCSLLDDVNRMIDETCEHIDMSWNSYPYLEKDDPILSDTRWKSLTHLSCQDWFKRGWTVQEAALAQHDLWLVRRASDLHHELNLGIMACHNEAYKQRKKAFARIFSQKLSWSAPSLLRTLNTARALELSDARDRIYAFMELPGSSEKVLAIKPNYNLAPLEIYRQFAMQYVRETKSIDILDFFQNRPCSADFDGPSWIPRWDVARIPFAPRFHQDGVPLSSRDGSIGEPEVVDHQTLSARGVVTDSIRYASDDFEYDLTTPQSVRELWTVVGPMLEDSPYESSYRLDAFLNALSLGKYDGEWWEWWRSRAAFKAYLQTEHDERTLNEPSHHDHISSNRTLEISRIHMQGTRLVVTVRGYIGLADVVVQKDDLCGIIFGRNIPCVLRQVPDSNYYSFIGSAYLMGKKSYEIEEGIVVFCDPLGHEDSKDWVEWDVEEQDIYLL
ncbi:HET-domain-containing protein [Alternaria alternata]|uniref:HET-domain-containing protein n=1 Tax=Alternaria alternata TaxID=5599 RepID=A0A177DK68_ALTAL|nr:HET-domain-containing protein [Alternaria alternata]OAG19591.1 HET-domain-containing protein [Alternaria alternata]